MDSTIANLALMKISSWRKSLGERVMLYRHRKPGPNLKFHDPIPADVLEFAGSADRWFQSCTFTWNREQADKLEDVWDGLGPLNRGRIGGTGYDHGNPSWGRSYLPPEAETAPPDYDLYPPTAQGKERFDYALGFCNRGCNRSCTFCDVPNKEGKIDPLRYRPPWTWIPNGFRKAMLLDNDVALYPLAQLEEILGWFPKAGVLGSITQGWDLRETTEQNASIVRAMKPRDLKFKETRLYVAWDYVGIENYARRGIERLLAAGFKPRELCCYILVGHDPHYPDGCTPIGDARERASALHRFHVLWDGKCPADCPFPHDRGPGGYGVYPYVMRYNNRRDDPWINAFTRYVDRPRNFKSHSWEDYSRRPQT